MGCIETIPERQLYHHIQIKSNMGCIETAMLYDKKGNRDMIKSNMGCIETSLRSHVKI